MEREGANHEPFKNLFLCDFASKKEWKFYLTSSGYFIRKSLHLLFTQVGEDKDLHFIFIGTVPF